MDGRMDWCIDALLKVCVYFWNTGNKQGEMPAAFISPTLPPNIHAETNRRRHLHAANSHTPWNEILTFSSTFWQYPRRGALMKIPSNRSLTMYHLCWQKKPKQLFPAGPWVFHSSLAQQNLSKLHQRQQDNEDKRANKLCGDVQLHLGRGHSKDDAPPRGNQICFLSWKSGAERGQV